MQIARRTGSKLVLAALQEKGKKLDLHHHVSAGLFYGSIINLIGIPFAVPYFGAIAQMLKADLSVTGTLALLAAFALANLSLLLVKRRDPRPRGHVVFPVWVPVAGFVFAHLVNGVVDGVVVELFRLGGDIFLALTRTELGLDPRGEIGLGIGNHHLPLDSRFLDRGSHQPDDRNETGYRHHDGGRQGCDAGGLLDHD